MTTMSPMGYASETVSSEVVQDFADSLKDLAGNNKYEIQNLTMIAKESTEHAQAISQAVEQHIKSTQPQRKLPALYVLDSIVKNVGTPYTVYFGRNLYSTFMEAYLLVDGSTRRAMEAMLKTWKEPAFGSMDSRPVLAPEIVRPIENALMKSRAIAMPQQRMPMQNGYQSIPTPPQFGQFQPPPHQIGHYAQYPPQQQVPLQYYQQQPTPVQHQYHQQPLPQNDVEVLKRDLSSLIRTAEQDLARDMYNAVLQTKLKALHDLNTILHTKQLGPAEFGMIAGQIRAMSNAMPSVSQPTPHVMSTHQWQPPQTQPPQPTQNYQPPSSIPPVQLNGLAALLSSVPKPSTPQVRAAVPSLQDAPHAQFNAFQARAQAAPASTGSDLLAALTQAGLVKPSNPLPTAQPPANAVSANLAALLGSLSKTGPQATSANQSIDLTSKSSIETFRPELVHQLYSDQPSQCPQCARRFSGTAQGLKQKDLHLDWHFRINQRIADSARGHHRNWYLNEIDWMKLTEFDASTATADSKLATNDSAKASSMPTQSYIRAPVGVTRVTCSICYEEMRSSYMEEIQDWIFTNAAMNNGKIVHASCLAEMQQGVQAVPQAASSAQQSSLAAVLAGLANSNREASKTPDSSLGKRKAEDQTEIVSKFMKQG